MKTLPATALGSRSADFNRTAYHLVVDPAVGIDDLMRPNFWAHHALNLRKGDVLDVLAMDDAFDITLRVVETGVGFVAMRPLRVWTRDGHAEGTAQPTDLPDVPGGYKVNHAPKTGWRVLTEDPVIEISRNHKSKLDAIHAAIDHAAKAGA